MNIDENKPSHEKPYIKLPTHFDLIYENFVLTNEEISKIVMDTFPREAIEGIVTYATAHRRKDVKAKIDANDPVVQAQKAARKESDLEARAKHRDVFYNNTANHILNMTGRMVRAIQHMPASCFEKVGDNQHVYQVMSRAEVINLLIEHRYPVQ